MVEQLNTGTSPIDQLNTRSLGYVVGQMSEGQVLVDAHGQVLMTEQLNTDSCSPVDQLNSLSLGHFVGQRPGNQVSADEHQPKG